MGDFALAALVFQKEQSVNEPTVPFEVLVIWRGVQFLTILTFAAFLGWAVWHLYLRFWVIPFARSRMMRFTTGKTDA
jgi:hypothetical protein